MSVSRKKNWTEFGPLYFMNPYNINSGMSLLVMGPEL